MHAVLIVYSSRDIMTYPAILNWIRILSERGWSIDLIANEKMKTQETLSTGTNCFWVSDDKYYYYKQLQVLLDKNITSDSWLIAFQIEGLFAAASINAINSVKTVYVSLEIIYKKYLKRSYVNWPFFVFIMARLILVVFASESFSVWKRRIAVALYESKCWLRLNKYGKDMVRYAVAQDNERVRLLKDEQPYINNSYVIPNAYIDYDEAESQWAHQYFGLSSETKILLFAGMIEEGFDLSLFDVLARLPDGYVAIINAYSRDGFLNRINEYLVKGIDAGKVIIHSTILTECDYDRLVSSCRIGLVWYSQPDPDDKNMFFIGLSSGKLCKYLSKGKPVITQRGFYGYSDLIDKNGIGVTCAEAEDLLNAVSAIEKNYGDMQFSVRNFVSRHLDVKSSIERIVTSIEQCR